MKRSAPGTPSLRERLDLVPLLPAAGAFLLCAPLGAVSVLGFAPFYLFPIPILTLAALVSMWRRAASAGQALVLGLGFGLGYFLTGTSWVYVSMHDFGGMPWPIAGFATTFFCSYFALFPAAIGWLFARPHMPEWVRLTIWFPCLWALGEWTRGWTFTGFPWLAIGYSQSPSGPLSGYAPVAGVYAVSLLAAGCAGLLVCACRGLGSNAESPLSRRIGAIVRHPALALIAALWLVGWGLQRMSWSAAHAEPITVSLIQGNIKQDMKWDPKWIEASLETYLKLVLRSRSRLILLPETALPVFMEEVPSEYFNALAQRARENDGDILLGIPEYVRGNPPRYYNSVMSLGTHPAQVYRKYHLVPFGDYFPHWGFLNWIMSALQIPMSDFSRGDRYQQPIDAAGERIAVNICYEDAFGEEIIRQLPAATLLANFTNDAWWGDSIASDQHLQMAQMRTQETGRFMLRATNTGVTAVIDRTGHIVASAPKFATVTLNARAQGYSGRTPYIVWGNWPFLVLSFGAIGSVLAVSRRRKKTID